MNISDLIQGGFYAIESVDTDGRTPWKGECVYIGVDTSEHYPEGTLEFKCSDGEPGFFSISEVKALVPALSRTSVEARKRLFAFIRSTPSLTEAEALQAIASFEKNAVAVALAAPHAEQNKIDAALAGLFDPDGPGDCGDRLVAAIDGLKDYRDRYEKVALASLWMHDDPAIKSLPVGSDVLTDGLKELRIQLMVLRKLVEVEGTAKERANLKLDAIRAIVGPS